MEKLTTAEIKEALAETPGWRKKGAAITRLFEFKDFDEAMRFVNVVARLAAKADHHPDIDIRWNQVTLTLSTHSAGGLTANDFSLARQIDRKSV
jgi:4a-hydroxytetrahydrobiopterin dehydratase